MSTTISKPRKAHPDKPIMPSSVPAQDSSCRFVLASGLSIPALLRKFMSLFPRKSLALWLGDKVFYGRGFTPLITLWCMVFQHLSGKSTMEDVLEYVGKKGADRLSPKGKPLSKTIVSESTSSWSDARARLPVGAVHKALQTSGHAIREAVQNRLWHGMEPVVLDGTTLRARPLGDIAQEFPPHRSGKSSCPYWCLARSVVAFCMATGAVLDCFIGPTKLSEQAMVLEMLMLSLWKNAIFVADRNFGVYSVVRGALHAKAHILVRLTDSRAKKLAREANVKLEEGLDQVIQWKPSRHDQCPESLTKEPLTGRLIALQVQPKGFRAFTLYLFTTLVDAQFTVQELARFYGQRWQVELNLRHVKTQMGLEYLDCKSADMVRKLWLTGLLAYNLVRASMSMAAACANMSILSLSFSRCLKALHSWLDNSDNVVSVKSWEKLLRRMARFTLPKRSKPRPSEPRSIRYYKRDFPKLVGDRAAAREKLALANSIS